MRKMLTIVVLASLAFMAPGLQAAGAIDGKTFKGKIIEKGSPDKKADKLVFEDGKFTSTGCTEYGFKATDYQATAKGDKTEFTAVAVNEKGAKMSWTGTVAGDKVDAKATWSHEGEPSKEMTFKGKLEKKK